MFDRPGLWPAVLVITSACGGATKAPEAAPATEAKPESTEPAATAEPKAGDPAAAEPAAKAEPAASDAPALKGRDITYHPTAEGLTIDVEGVKLEPKAEPLKMAAGWGLKITLRATSTDGHIHKLLKSAKGPMMIATEIERSGKKERTSDERKGEAEEFLTPGDANDFEQKIEQPVWGNQSITAYVGLWGLGTEAGERRPVRKLFIVKMVPGQKKPAAVVSPPE